jgi:hypothetical protein
LGAWAAQAGVVGGQVAAELLRAPLRLGAAVAGAGGRTGGAGAHRVRILEQGL